MRRKHAPGRDRSAHLSLYRGKALVDGSPASSRNSFFSSYSSSFCSKTDPKKQEHHQTENVKKKREKKRPTKGQQAPNNILAREKPCRMRGGRGGAQLGLGDRPPQTKRKISLRRIKQGGRARGTKGARWKIAKRSGGRLAVEGEEIPFFVSKGAEVKCKGENEPLRGAHNSCHNTLARRQRKSLFLVENKAFQMES